MDVLESDCNSWGHSLLTSRCRSPAERRDSHQEEKQTGKDVPQSREDLCVLFCCPNIHPACMCFSIAIYIQTRLKQTPKHININTFLVQYKIKSKTCGLISILPTSNRTQQVGPMETILNMFSGDPGSNLYRVISQCIFSILKLDENGGALQ
jgi:hypothetical protein